MRRLTSATAIGMALAATPAFADVTPKSVWDYLSEYYQRAGTTVAFDAVEEAGDTLSVSNLVLTQQSENGNAVVEMGDLVLTATGDGAVRLDANDKISVAMDVAVPDEDGGDADMARLLIDISLTDEDVIIREDGDAMVYDYTLPQMQVKLSQLDNGDGDVFESPVVADITNLKGRDRLAGEGEMMDVTQSGSAKKITLNLDFQGDDGAMKAGFTLDDVTLASNGIMLTNLGGDALLGDMLDAGMKMNLEFKAAGVTSSGDINVKEEDGTPRNTTFNVDSGETTLNIAMDRERIRYAGSAGNTNSTIAMTGLPQTIAYQTTGTSFAVDFPVSASEDPQDFGISYALSDLTLSDDTWKLFDPKGALPRDPASLDIDLGGSLKVMRSFFDQPEIDAEKMSDPDLSDEERQAIVAEMMASPADVLALDIKKIALSAVGVTADVTGSLSAPQEGSVREPVGTVSGRFTGLNGLLEKLSEAGLMPAEQMMGARMMMAMFAKADPENPDVMKTELEFREGGEIFANGQQVK